MAYGNDGGDLKRILQQLGAHYWNCKDEDGLDFMSESCPMRANGLLEERGPL
jgi:hypothetical protein